MLEEIEGLSIAVLLPCYNEEVTIGKVVRDFKAALSVILLFVTFCLVGVQAYVRTHVFHDEEV